MTPNMQLPDLLVLFSELAIGFLAFTALITVIADSRSDKTSAKAVASGSVTVPIIFLLASALPFAYLTSTELTATGWRVASGMLLLFWVIDYSISVARALRDLPHLKSRALVEASVVTIFCYLPILANVFGFFSNPQDGYVLGLCILLLTSCILFARVVSIVMQVRFRSDRGGV